MDYTIGPRSLRHVVPTLSKTRSNDVANVLGDAFHRYHITTPRRAAAAVAQMAEESAGFSTTREFASGAEYEGRVDLGNIHPGDGRRYKGRGFIQITGRNNYAAVSRALGHNFVAHPEKLENLYWAAQASCWWWANHGCNELADRKDFVGLTRRINGGLNGLAVRKAFWRRARFVGRFLTPRRR